MSEIIPITGTPGIEVISGEYIALKPMCDGLGLDIEGQRRKLKECSWAVTEKISATGADGKTYQMTVIHKDSVPMWLATISEKKVRDEEVRKTLIRYQKEAAKALNDYFTKGVAVNPNADLDRLRAELELKELENSIEYNKNKRKLELEKLEKANRAELLQLECQGQLDTLQKAKGLMHEDHLNSHINIVVAQALHQKPQLEASKSPLYIKTYLKEKGLPSNLMSKAGQFGKLVKKAYIELYAEEPKKYPMTLANGQVREVLAYTEEDRDLLDEVYEGYFGEIV